MKDFRSLNVWQNAHSLTIGVYRETRGFPKEELYGLTSQLRRAALSIGANLAEGCGRGSDRELTQYVQVAMGSASELEYHLLLAHDLSYVASDHYTTMHAAVCEIKKMLVSLLKTLRGSR